eukprot:12913129-Prorocentrum_lima.AAC.1
MPIARALSSVDGKRMPTAGPSVLIQSMSGAASRSEGAVLWAVLMRCHVALSAGGRWAAM